VVTHDVVNLLHINRWLGLPLMLPTQQAPDPAITVAGQRADGLLDLLDQVRMSLRAPVRRPSSRTEL